MIPNQVSSCAIARPDNVQPKNTNSTLPESVAVDILVLAGVKKVAEKSVAPERAAPNFSGNWDSRKFMK